MDGFSSRAELVGGPLDGRRVAVEADSPAILVVLRRFDHPPQDQVQVMRVGLTASAIGPLPLTHGERVYRYDAADGGRRYRFRGQLA